MKTSTLFAAAAVLLLGACSPPGSIQEQLLGSSNIEKVKESVLVLDQTRTLAQALELSDCFTETKWSSFTDESGREIVQFEGKFKDFSPFAFRIRPALGRTHPDNKYTTFSCGTCTYVIQFAMLKSQTAIPGLGIEGSNFTILRSWFDADVTKRVGGITHNAERLRAPERGGDELDAIALNMFGLAGSGLASPALQQVYTGNFPEVIATVFTSISAALNEPHNRDFFTVFSDEAATEMIRREQEQTERRRLQALKYERERPERERREKAERQERERRERENEAQWYYESVHQEFYDAWDHYLVPVKGLSATLEVKIGADGEVLSRRISKSSSNGEYDRVVLEGARRVETISAKRPKSLNVTGAMTMNIVFALN
jgi:TonB family protein